MFASKLTLTLLTFVFAGALRAAEPPKKIGKESIPPEANTGGAWNYSGDLSTQAFMINKVVDKTRSASSPNCEPEEIAKTVASLLAVSPVVEPPPGTDDKADPKSDPKSERQSERQSDKQKNAGTLSSEQKLCLTKALGQLNTSLENIGKHF